MTKEQIQDDVKSYYGETLTSSEDLKTSACCPIDAVPVRIRPYLAKVHEEVTSRFYGCGSPIPEAIAGKTVLDLGCGTGRDCYVLSQLVGEKGHVIGVDMTEEQLAVARKYQEYHRDVFGHTKSNIEFIHGEIEHLKTIKDNSVDIIVSNCVINLSSNKEAVFKEIFRTLKPGGELYFSDVFADRRIPTELQKDAVLLGECLSGALYNEDFRRVMEQVGFLDFRVVSSGPITLDDKEVKAKIGMVNFTSKTIRAFKVECEDRCEDYGHSAIYKGTIEDAPHVFSLDDHHHFYTKKPMLICGNTAKMLGETRFKEHFDISGNFDTHLGFFECGNSPASDSTEAPCC